MKEDGLTAGGVEVSLKAVVERLSDFIEEAERSRRDDDSVAAAYNLRREFAAMLPEDGGDAMDIWPVERAESFCRSYGGTVEDILSLAI